MNRKYNSKLPDRSSLDFILIFHHMKTGYSLLYGMFFLLNACGQPEPQEEYDSIITSVYTNNYDTNGRLSEVLIEKQSRFLDHGVYIPGYAIEIVRKYIYSDNDTYTITETNNLFPDKMTETVVGKTFEKHYTLDNGDTTEFRMRSFADTNKLKPLLEIEKWKFSGFPISDFEENRNIETHYYYDRDGNQTGIIRKDFNSGETVETYRFKDSRYDQAIKTVPESENKQDIICYSEKTVADTVITLYHVNMDAPYSTKRYVDNGKSIEITYDTDQKPQYIATKYTANGFDIEVRETIPDGIDSIYCIKGKEVRCVTILPEGKSITISEYDEKGNITKEVEKSKSDTKISDEEWDGIIQRYKEFKKTEN